MDMDSTKVRREYVERINALSREIANGVTLKGRLEQQVSALTEQMLRIEGAKMLTEEMLKSLDVAEQAHAQAAEARSAAKKQS